MKFIFILFCFLFSLTTQAKNEVDLDLKSVSLNDLVTLVYGQVLHQPFVIDSDLINDTHLVTFNLIGLTPEKIETETKNIIKAHGYDIQKINSIVRIIKNSGSDNDDLQVNIYTPQHRSASFLLDMVSPFFQDVQFSNQRNKGNLKLNDVTGTNISPPNQQNELGATAALNKDVELLLFKSSKKDSNNVIRLLKQLDLALVQVVVKVAVYEVRKGDSDTSGIDILTNLFNSKLGLNLAGGASSAVGSISSKLTFAGIDLSLAYSAIKSDNRFKLLTTPNLLVKSGSSAKFSVGDETPVLGNVSFDKSGQAIQAVEYKTSGIIFDVSPIIRNDDIDLNLHQTISSFQQTTNGVNSSPTLIKRELSTSVIAHDDDLIVIGGLDQNQDSDSKSGLSFLPAVFNSKKSTSSHTDIVMVLSVHKI